MSGHDNGRATDRGLSRRAFVKALGVGSAAAGGLVLGRPSFGQGTPPPAEVETNIAEFMAVPKKPWSLPGPFPGKVIHVADPACLVDDKPDAAVVNWMVQRGITGLTGKDMAESFKLLFAPDDVVGIKINPVGYPLINVRHEVVDAVIGWLTANGLPRERIIIWDRFDLMLAEARYTPERFPGVGIVGLQTMDEEGAKWRDAAGHHVSEANFDPKAFYFAKGIEGKAVRGYKDDEFYLNQHVFAGEYSYFGRLLTEKLTKIINIAVFKNTGNGVSMVTKNIGYGAVCNTGRLHAPLFFRVNTEVCAAPWVRDKMVLSIIDGIRGQYDDGPMMNAKFVYPWHSLYFATDPFALDMIGHRHLVEKRKAAGVAVNEHPRYTEYLHYGEKLGLGVADPARIQYVKI